jgi:hypothetical protein
VLCLYKAQLLSHWRKTMRRPAIAPFARRRASVLPALQAGDPNAFLLQRISDSAAATSA